MSDDVYGTWLINTERINVKSRYLFIR